MMSFRQLSLLGIVTSVLAASASIDASSRQDLSHSLEELPLVLLQASAQVTRGMPDHSAPRMLVAEGCDGSTAMLQHAGIILSLHGFNTGAHDQQKELLDKPRNPFITSSNQDIILAMKSLKEDRKKKNQTLLFKSILHRDKEATLNRGLVDMGTMAVYSTRRNKLDQLICMIRDCFLNTHEDGPYGYPVNSEGEPSNLCFERRESNAKDYKAMIKVRDVPHKNFWLRDNLKWIEEQERQGEAMLKEAGYHATKVHYEDLVAFQEDEKNIPISLNAWIEVLTAWGVNANTERLNTYLTHQAGKWVPPPQRSTIFNVREVEAELKELGKQDLLRD